MKTLYDLWLESMALGDWKTFMNEPTTKAGARTRLTKADIGKTFTFHGYDDKLYRAELIDWRRKVATIRYIVRALEITAYISDLSRLDREVLV